MGVHWSVMLDIYIDADGCPVKDEILRVATRHSLVTTFVANTGMRLPRHESIRLEVVGEGADAADDWIAEHVRAGDIVITADMPLADRCVKRGATVVQPRGRELTSETMGEALASRDLMTDLRSTGMVTKGPPPFAKKDRSNFLQALERVVQRLRRSRASGSS